MSAKERASKGARASHESKTPDERRAHARHAYLAGAVKAVVDRAPELSPEQAAKLRAVFGGGASA